jgi:hypothetical protein
MLRVLLGLRFKFGNPFRPVMFIRVPGRVWPGHRVWSRFAGGKHVHTCLYHVQHVRTVCSIRFRVVEFQMGSGYRRHVGLGQARHPARVTTRYRAKLLLPGPGTATSLADGRCAARLQERRG